MTTEQLVNYVLIGFGFGFTIWVIKKDLLKISSRMDCFEKSQHACQLDNARDYATKADLKELEKQCDKTSEDVAALKAIVGKQ